MPLHGKQPFLKKPPPEGLKPTDKVFYNKLTGEIFDDFEEHFKRTVVCKSLVWSCELTMNSRMTYADALESERKARACLKNLPAALKRGLLFAITLTRRGRLVDLWEDVYNFVKDRYFIGEEIEALVDGQWVDCVVKSVLPPRESDLSKCKKEPGTPKGKAGNNSSEDTEDDGEKEGDAPVSYEAWPPAAVYKYVLEEVEYVDSEDESDEDEEAKERKKKKPDAAHPPKKHIVGADEVRRPRGLFTRAKNKLYVKLATEISETTGMLVVRKVAAEKHDLDSMRIEKVFVGPKPVFQVGSAAKKKFKPVSLDQPAKGDKKRGRPNSTGGAGPSKAAKQGDIRNFIGKGAASQPKQPKKEAGQPKKETLEERKERLEAEVKARIEAEKKRKMEEKEKKNEEKKLYNQLLKDWQKPKEDLELEDLQDLPAPTPIKCRVPNELFGGLLEILEFLTVFHKTLELGRWFPSGVSFEKIEEALTDQDMRGALTDLLTALLEIILKLQSEEEVEIASGNSKPDASLKEQFAIGSQADAPAKAVELATAAASWPRRYLGTALEKLPRDPCTISEVLRLHLLGSGAQCSENSKAWRYQQRGGYDSQDDPAIQFRLEHGDVLQKLTSQLVFRLSPAEKLSIIECLIGQVMTYVGFRDGIDDAFDQLSQKRKELVQLKANEKKKAKEEAMQKSKEKKEAKKEGKSLEPQKQEVEDASGRRLETRKQTEESRKKDDANRREKDLVTSIASLQTQHALVPLGRDRAYRRYWTCTSVPGIFVEDNDEFVGSCLPQPTPMPILNLPTNTGREPKQEDIRKFLTMHKAGVMDGSVACSPENGGSDKENDDDVESTPRSRKNGSEALGLSSNKAKENGAHNPIVKLEACPDADALRDKQSKWKEDMPKLEHGSRVFGMCTGRGHEGDCPVHSTTRDRVVWAYFSTPEQVDALVNGLNPRGLREKELRDHLIAEKDKLVSRLERCPVHKLDMTQASMGHLRAEPRHKSERRKGGSSAFLSYATHPAGTPSEQIAELTFRDRLLEMEEKIHLGNLGNLKVSERETWRDALISGTYDQQCDALVWAGGQYKEKQVLLTPRKPAAGDKRAKEDEEEKLAKLKIRQLAAALLQLEQSVEPRYMQPPLGETTSEKNKKKQVEEVDDDNSSTDEDDEEEGEKEGAKKPPKIKLTPLQRWELSLKNVSSFAQLFVHLEVLNTSIMWSRSTLHARCKVCRKKGEENLLLLCDGCNVGYHTTCLKPKLKAIPKGDWFCPNCKQPTPEPETTTRQRRPPPRRRAFSEDEEEEELDDEDEEEDEDEAEAEPEEERESGEEDGEGDDAEQSGKSDEEEEEEEDDDETIETDVCEACGETGELLACSKDECARMYHLDCVDPPMKKMPRGKWSCPACTDKLAKKNAKRSGGRDSSKRGEKRSLDDGWEPRSKRRAAASAAEGKIQEASRRLRNSNKDSGSEDDDDDDDDDDTGSENARVSSGTATRRSDRKVQVREDVDLDIAVLEKLLHDLTKHEDAWPFMRPVTKKDAPDYHERISHPMDFGTMKGKLSNGKYKTNEDFLSDVQLIIDNCRAYNEDDTQIFKCADNVEEFFHDELDELGLSYFYKSPSGSKRPRYR